jgi:hypothetical protein
LALLRQVSERIEEQVAQAMRESADADEEETVRRPLSAFAHTLVDDPRVAIVTFGEAAARGTVYYLYVVQWLTCPKCRCAS